MFVTLTSKTFNRYNSIYKLYKFLCMTLHLFQSKQLIVPGVEDEVN